MLNIRFSLLSLLYVLSITDLRASAFTVSDNSHGSENPSVSDKVRAVNRLDRVMKKLESLSPDVFSYIVNNKDTMRELFSFANNEFSSFDEANSEIDSKINMLDKTLFKLEEYPYEEEKKSKSLLSASLYDCEKQSSKSRYDEAVILASQSAYSIMSFKSKFDSLCSVRSSYQSYSQSSITRQNLDESKKLFVINFLRQIISDESQTSNSSDLKNSKQDSKKETNPVVFKIPPANLNLKAFSERVIGLVASQESFFSSRSNYNYTPYDSSNSELYYNESSSSDRSYLSSSSSYSSYIIPLVERFKTFFDYVEKVYVKSTSASFYSNSVYSSLSDIGMLSLTTEDDMNKSKISSSSSWYYSLSSSSLNNAQPEISSIELPFISNSSASWVCKESDGKNCNSYWSSSSNNYGNITRPSNSSIIPPSSNGSASMHESSHSSNSKHSNTDIEGHESPASTSLYIQFPTNSVPYSTFSYQPISKVDSKDISDMPELEFNNESNEVEPLAYKQENYQHDNLMVKVSSSSISNTSSIVSSLIGEDLQNIKSESTKTTANHIKDQANSLSNSHFSYVEKKYMRNKRIGSVSSYISSLSSRLRSELAYNTNTASSNSYFNRSN